MKTEGLASQLQELQGLKIVFEDKHNRASDLHLRPLPLKPTQDWTVVTGAFNSEDVAEAVALVGIWGDKTGSGVFRNVTVEEVGLQCPVCRQGTPLVVRKAVDGRVLAEGKDYAPPGHLKSLAFDGFETLDLGLSADMAVKEGELLLVDAYEPATEYGIQFSTCLSHPRLRRYYEESARAIRDWISPDAWFLSADEFRVECRCELCRRRDTDMAHKCAATLWDQRNVIRRLAPDAEILFWSDMADENHNARDRYCKCVTTFRGLADLLPKDMVAVPWWTEKAQASCDFFASRGFGVMPGAYYDKKTVEATQKDARDWCAALVTTPTARGIMYTAWYERYDMLGVFARTINDCAAKSGKCDFKLIGVKEKWCAKQAWLNL